MAQASTTGALIGWVYLACVVLVLFSIAAPRLLVGQPRAQRYTKRAVHYTFAVLLVVVCCCYAGQWFRAHQAMAGIGAIAVAAIAASCIWDAKRCR